jgi:hypothetical protein
MPVFFESLLYQAGADLFSGENISASLNLSGDYRLK